MALDVTRETISALEAEIAVQDEELKVMKAEYAALSVRYPPPPYTDRYYYIVKIPELSRELGSKRARLGWLKKRWIPELVAVELLQYATRGDSQHPYPYAWVHTYAVIDSDYEHLKEALKEHDYWDRYWRTGKLRILRVIDGYRYAFDEKEKKRPPQYILNGNVYVLRSDYSERPHICEHHAALTVAVLRTLGLVEGYRRERRRLTETELEYIPIRTSVPLESETVK